MYCIYVYSIQFHKNYQTWEILLLEESQRIFFKKKEQRKFCIQYKKSLQIQIYTLFFILYTFDIQFFIDAEGSLIECNFTPIKLSNWQKSNPILIP